MDPRSEFKTKNRQSDWKTEKKMEDEINEFLKQEFEDNENENPIERSNQTNKNWIKIAKDRRRWALSEESYTLTV